MTELNEMTIAANRGEIQLIFNDIPDLEFFENLELSCDHCTFFEVAVMSIKNGAMLHQAHFYNLKKAKVNKLTEDLNGWKKNYSQNVNRIQLGERELANIIESELKVELEHMRVFDRLNSEKITPHFMALAKKSGADEDLTDIKDDNNADFTGPKEQETHITNFYKELYRKQDNLGVRDCNIEEFLGNIANNEIVQNSKLTEDEKNELDTELTLDEFDKSMNQANLNSAPGINGISNRFIKKFWNLFRVPLFKYSKCALDRGSLTDSFKTAKIKLIPKKGDCTKIKNWRPISLLNCFYKILSRLITTRIRKYIDKLTPIGQRGYSKNRYCQEVLVNLCDEIQQCKIKNLNAVLVSLDIKKAFDSLSNIFVERALNFFNFGPVMISWLKTICFNRKACIVLGGNHLSEIFDLGRGNAQGDNISPFIFIICYQILLFRI